MGIMTGKKQNENPLKRVHFFLYKKLFFFRTLAYSIENLNQCLEMEYINKMNKKISENCDKNLDPFKDLSKILKTKESKKIPKTNYFSIFQVEVLSVKRQPKSAKSSWRGYRRTKQLPILIIPILANLNDH